MHRLKLAVLTCSVLLFVPLAVPLVTGRVFAFDDLVSFHLPLRFVYQQALRSGDSTLWSPAIFSGFYVFGEGQVGMAHPFHYALYRFLPLQVAFNLEVAASYVLALYGTRMMLSRLGLAIEASWFGAMLFAFSGSMLLHLMHVNAVAIAAHMPWLLLSVHVLMTTDRQREIAWAFAAIVVLLVSQLLLGHPQYFWISSTPIVIMAGALVVARARWMRFLLVGAAMFLGVLGGAVQWLPTIEVLLASIRSAPTAEFRSQFSLRFWRDGLNLLAPQRFPVELLNEQASYGGAFAAIALAWIAVRWRAVRHHGLIAGSAALAALGVLLSLGSSGGLYEWLAQVPGIGSFRVPARYMILVHLALSALGAVAFEDLAGLVRRREAIAPWHLLALAVAPVIAIAVTLSAAQPLFLRDPPGANLAQPWPYVVLLLAATGLVVLAARHRRWALPMLVPLVALDLGAWGYGYIYRANGAASSVRAIDEIAAAVSLPSAVEAGDLIFLWGGNTPLLQGVRMLPGYAGLTPLLTLNPGDLAAQRLAGVKWTSRDGTWKPVSGTMPRARLVSDVRLSTRIVEDLQTIDIASVALVDTVVGALSGPPGDVSQMHDRPGSIGLETAASGAQVLILTERFDDGWKAAIDGHPIRVLRAYGEYLACEVPPGRHRIAFTFDPESFTLGRRLSVIAIVATLGVTFVLARRRTAERSA